jgi:hypothetical protein
MSTVLAEDADCDTVLTADDCDDNDALSNTVADDADCDGDITGDDCDDNDPWLNYSDMDADGWSTCDGDCDDNDATSNYTEIDADCDGDITEDDCDDNDATLNNADLDGDGNTTCNGDCDDNDSTSTHTGIDADCDSVITGDDCDDHDALSTVRADDADCDGDLTADDCDDENPNLSTLDSDADGYSTCDGDCDDDDATLTPEDYDADGLSSCGDLITECYSFEMTDSYGDGWAASHISIVVDGVEAMQVTNTGTSNVENATYCSSSAQSLELYFVDDDMWDNEVGISITDSSSNVLYSLIYGTWETSSENSQLLYSAEGTYDCDDNDAYSTFSDEDADCDSVVTADDCDDTDSSVLSMSNDADCDGTVTADDCDDNDETLNLDDVDGDTWTTCDGDCDDDDSTMNLDDADADLWTTCDGDCDDSDATLNLDDYDGDGIATCETWVTFSDCYEIIVNDSYGDGWNDSTLDFTVDGVLEESITVYTEDDYDFLTFELCVTDVSYVSIDWTDLTSWDAEVGITVTDEDGTAIVAIASGDWTSYVDYSGNLALIEESYVDCDDYDATVYENCTP